MAGLNASTYSPRYQRKLQASVSRHRSTLITCSASPEPAAASRRQALLAAGAAAGVLGQSSQAGAAPRSEHETAGWEGRAGTQTCWGSRSEAFGKAGSSAKPTAASPRCGAPRRRLQRHSALPTQLTPLPFRRRRAPAAARAAWHLQARV